MNLLRKRQLKPDSDAPTVAGIDLGATKAHVLDSRGQLFRYASSDFSDLYAVIAKYFEDTKHRPSHVAVAAAGPRNDENGSVRISNLNWPPFAPAEAEKRFPGTTFHSTHDVGAVAAAVAYARNVETIPLKTGRALRNAPIIVVTLSSGVGVSAAIWDDVSGRYVLFSGEAGHMGFQPSNETEQRLLKHIFGKYEHPSIELAISGNHGIIHWLEQSPEMEAAPELAMAMQSAIDRNQPPGAVLLAYATEGNGVSQQAAHAILKDMGRLVGSILADFALGYRATGGIYLTGSVSMGLSEYWAKQNVLGENFIRRGTNEHAPWLEEMLEGIPIYLITDPYVAVRGALAMAEQQSNRT